MGDAQLDNVWEGEDEIDLTRKVDSDDEIDSDDEDSDAPTSGVDKKSKRKAKFDAMKEKKRLKLSSLSSESEVENNRQMDALQMLVELRSHLPEDLDLPNGDKYTESNFFYPDLEESSATKSAKGNCPFVRALSAAMPSYRKLLLETSEVPRENHGCPVLLIVCPSALRATEIIKSVSSKLIKVKIAKLFAKHFKVQEQMEMLDAEYFPIAVGTPHRLSKLIEVGSLSLRLCKVVLVDVTPDAKKYSILSLHEVKHDFYRLLYNEVFAVRNKAKIALITQFADESQPNVNSGEKKVKKPFARPTSKKNGVKAKK